MEIRTQTVAHSSVMQSTRKSMTRYPLYDRERHATVLFLIGGHASILCMAELLRPRRAALRILIRVCVYVNPVSAFITWFAGRERTAAAFRLRETDSTGQCSYANPRGQLFTVPCTFRRPQPLPSHAVSQAIHFDVRFRFVRHPQQQLRSPQAHERK